MILRLLALVLGAAGRIRPEPNRSELEQLSRELRELAIVRPQRRSSA